MARGGSSLVGTVVSLVLLLPAGQVSMAQEDQEGPAAGPSVCSGWPGGMLTPGSVDESSRIPICTLQRVPAAEVPVLENLSMTTIPGLDDDVLLVPDSQADQFLLTDGSLPGNADPATDILATYFTTIDLDRPGAGQLRDKLGDLPADAILTTGRPLGRLVRPGDWAIYVIDTEGDPTRAPEMPIVYQIGFMGPPGRSVSAVFPNTNVLDGVRHVLHLRHDPSAGGDSTFSVLWSDFGSRRLGPDGQTQYYNATPGFFTITSPDGIVVFVPHIDQLDAFRPMAWDSASGAWDVGSAPDGPMAFIPGDGTAPWYFDYVMALLDHTQVPDQTFTFDGNLQTGATLPSGILEAFESGLLGGIEPPPTFTVGLDLEQRRLIYEEAQRVLLEEPGWTALHHGIPAYGSYCIREYGFQVPTWSDGTPVSEADVEAFANATFDVRRALGFSCMRVDDADGLMHGAAHETWLDGHGWWEWNPEAARRLLEGAGWVEGPDGQWRRATRTDVARARPGAPF